MLQAGPIGETRHPAHGAQHGHHLAGPRPLWGLEGGAHDAGAMGLGQIMPDEARDHGVSNPYDPIQNVRTCINLLRMKLDLYADGSPDNNPSDRRIELALAAYNAGAGAVRKYGYTVPPYKETQNYVRKIMRIYHDLTGQRS